MGILTLQDEVYLESLHASFLPSRLPKITGGGKFWLQRLLQGAFSLQEYHTLSARVTVWP